MYKQQSEAFDLLDKDEVEGVLSGAFYHPPPPAPERPRAKPLSKPEHYKVICISLYTEDLDRLDAAVRDLKRRGHTKASRSSVLRAAMMQLDLAKVPRGI